jgi:hypothetical protein
MMKRFLFFLIAILLSSSVPAQENHDTINNGDRIERPALPEPYHRNTIKFNPTPMLIWSEIRNLTFSYERMINNNMSLSLQVGLLRLPFLIDDTLADLLYITDRNKTGMNSAFDYRYYVFARNPRPAPDGLYIGGYLSYYESDFNSKFNVLGTPEDQYGEMKGKLDIANLGFELGYQFIFWKRLSIDMLLFGPSLSYFGGKLNFSGNLDPDTIDNIDQAVVDKLLERYPALGALFSEGDLTFTGNRTKFDTFFRYSIQLGYHF